MQASPKQIDIRAQRRLEELEYHRYSFRGPVGGWTYSSEWPKHIVRNESADRLDALSPPTAEGGVRFVDHTIHVDYAETQTIWLGTSVVTPPECNGKPLRLRILTDAEGTLYVDGSIWHGIDENHGDIVLSDCCEAGRTYRLDLMVFGGRDRKSKTVRIELAVRDESIEAFRNDLRTLVGVARSVRADDAVGVRLWRAIEASLDAIDFHASISPQAGFQKKYDSPDVSRASQILSQHLQTIRELGLGADDREIYLTGNSHIDVTWLWTLAETRFKMGRTTATALRMMEQFPQYRFAQSQAQLYEFLRTDFPDLFLQVDKRIRDGQWEIAGATWVEPDCNVVGGESLVRQILYAQQFWNEHFNRESKVLWLPDTFGYSSALPQICLKSGLDTFVTQKLLWNDVNPLPHGHFDWEGIDGSRIRCTFPQTYGARTFPEEIAKHYAAYPSKVVAPDLMYLYGCGDGGGGPVPEDIEIGSRLDDVPGFPHCSFSKAGDALDRIRARADEIAIQNDTPVPVWRGELYLEFHRGTLTTRGRMKRANRRCELALREVEIWSSIASVVAGFEYPADDLEAAWKKVLLNQFHDTLPGTSIPAVYPEAHALYEAATTTTDRLRGAALDVLTKSADRVERSVSLANSLSWEVTEWTEVQWLENAQRGKPSPEKRSRETSAPERTMPEHVSPEQTLTDRSLPHGEMPTRLLDEYNRSVPFQFLSGPGNERQIGFEARVPALGCATYRFTSGPAEQDAIDAGNDFLENDRFYLKFADAGTLASIYDKDLQREWLAGPGNELQTFDDRPEEWEAWNLSESYERRRLNLFRLDEQSLVEVGPARATMRQVYSTQAGSILEQDIVIYRTIPRIDFLTRIDWHERRVLLKTAFPLAITNTRATYEIQFGSIERSTHRNTTWDAAKFEVCGHTWADLSEGSGGVSLLNDCKYGHDTHDNVMRLTLLRNAVCPDPRNPSRSFLYESQEDEAVFTDTGRHEVRYSLFPHAGDWRNDTVRQAHSLNNPLRLVSGPMTGLLRCVVSDPAVVLETLKKAEDGNGLILRVYEAHGGRRKVTLDLPFRVDRVDPVNLMERPAPDEGEVVLTNEGGLEFDILPYEIRTFRCVPIPNQNTR